MLGINIEILIKGVQERMEEVECAKSLLPETGSYDIFDHKVDVDILRLHVSHFSDIYKAWLEVDTMIDTAERLLYVMLKK